MNQKNEEPGNLPKKDADMGIFSLGKGLMLSATITGYILGPLVLLGGVGLWLDRIFGTKPWIMLGALAIAFLTTNTLIYKQSNKIAEKFIDTNKQ